MYLFFLLLYIRKHNTVFFISWSIVKKCCTIILYILILDLDKKKSEKTPNCYKVLQNTGDCKL